MTSPISLEQAPTLAALFRQRVKESSDQVAYIQYQPDLEQWTEYSWQQTATQVYRWQQAIKRSGLVKGDRIAIMLRNSWEWVTCDQAALGLGMALVPIFVNDRAENIAWIVNDSGSRMLVLDNQEQWDALVQVSDQLNELKQIVTISSVKSTDDRVVQVAEWLQEESGELATDECGPNELASIVYTSGTTGRPKGVMLSHHNILWNIAAGLKQYDIGPDNLFLSFLPLSHTFERTVGYYMPMVCGATIAYNRSIPELAEDLELLKPTIMVSVPRIFERIYGKIMGKLETESPVKRKLFTMAIKAGWQKFELEQGRGNWSPILLLQPLLDKLVGSKVRQKLGGRLWFTVCGGAALSPEVAQLFIGLGIPVQQGYGLTETSPIISANTLEDNLPSSVGPPLPGIEIKTSDQGELLTRSPSVMLGYWNNPEATAGIIDDEGWLHTGDKVSIDEANHITITGRLKEIIVLANGEKVPPADMENAIVLDPLIEQVMLIGEGKPYLSALLVPNPDQFASLCDELGVEAAAEDRYENEKLQQLFIERINEQLKAFPGHAQVYQVAILQQPMTPENGLLTPTLKLRRNRILNHFSDEVLSLYKGH